MKGVCIIGGGFVGTSVGMGFRSLGIRVICYDVNDSRVKQLRNLDVEATKDLKWAASNSDFSFVCVPTPNKNQRIDLDIVKSAVSDLAFCLRSINSYHVVVIKSTVIPTSTENALIPLLRKISRKKIGAEIGVCVNPDFSTESNQSWTDDHAFARSFSNQDRIVIGEFDKRSGDSVQELYAPLGSHIIRTELRTAETIKYACNCALAAKISYWNEIYYICRQLKVSSDIVAEVAGMDNRIGKYGTANGLAFDGKCLPKDLEAFVSFCQDLGYDPKLLRSVIEVNETIRKDRGERK